MPALLSRAWMGGGNAAATETIRLVAAIGTWFLVLGVAMSPIGLPQN